MSYEYGPDEATVVERLTRERAIPHPAFRGWLARRLLDQDPGYGPRPPRLRRRVATTVAAGGVLLGCAWLAALGGWPFS